jgi:glutathione S-transferase
VASDGAAIVQNAAMFTIHHLGKSQSERIVWLCEELGVPYRLQLYQRDATTMLAPPELRALHPAGTAPVLTEGDVVLPESSAIAEYILARHGKGRLAVGPEQPGYADYLYWFHFANGNLQPHAGRNMVLNRLGLPPDNKVLLSARERMTRAYGMLEQRLGEVPYLAGDAFTAADVMNLFSMTTMRYFSPWDLAPYPNVLAYIQRMAARPAYQAAMRKGDAGMELLLT